MSGIKYAVVGILGGIFSSLADGMSCTSEISCNAVYNAKSSESYEDADDYDEYDDDDAYEDVPKARNRKPGAKGRSNQVEKEEFKEAVRRIQKDIGRHLSDDEQTRLHQEITGQGLDVEGIRDIGSTLFGP